MACVGEAAWVRASRRACEMPPGRQPGAKDVQQRKRRRMSEAERGKRRATKQADKKQKDKDGFGKLFRIGVSRTDGVCREEGAGGAAASAGGWTPGRR